MIKHHGRLLSTSPWVGPLSLRELEEEGLRIAGTDVETG